MTSFPFIIDTECIMFTILKIQLDVWHRLGWNIKQERHVAAFNFTEITRANRLFTTFHLSSLDIEGSAVKVIAEREYAP